MIVLFLAFRFPPDWVYLNAKTVQDGHTQRGIEMYNKVLDEAVEVAVRTFRSDMSIDENGCVGPHTKMRAALLAGVKVLLGQVGYGYIANGSGQLIVTDDRFKDMAHVFALYRAPSLGEGE